MSYLLLQLDMYFAFRQTSVGPGATMGYRSAPGKPETTRVKVPSVELDGSRPKEMPGMRP